MQQTLKDFIGLLSILIACCTNTSKPPFSTGSSDHAHTGPCQGSRGTLELFMLLAPQDFVDSATLSQESVFCKTTAFLSEAEKQPELLSCCSLNLQGFECSPWLCYPSLRIEAGLSLLRPALLQPSLVTWAHTTGKETGQRERWKFHWGRFTSPIYLENYL